MLSLTNPVQPYAWGATDGVAELVGSPPTGGPEAELWIGAHPSAPSRLADGRTLDEVLGDEAEAEALLGADLVGRFGPRLPFLLKLLAIGSHLSVQLHPSDEQAVAGFAREEATGLDRDDPSRSYRDPYAKPEVLVAVVPTWVLAGLRTGADAARRLREVEDPAVAGLAALVADAPDAREALVALVTAPEARRAAWAAAAAATPVSDDDPARRWVRRLAAAQPGDPTALAPLLLTLRHLAPGDGIFLPAGVPHAYLKGAGIELLGASDNVVRGGLTPKHVDADELVALLAPPGTDAVPLAGEPVAPGVHRYAPGVPEITLHRIDADGGWALAPAAPAGPALALAVGGAGDVEVGDRSVALDAGRAVLVAAGERDGCRVRGPATIWWATAGDPPAGA